MFSLQTAFGVLYISTMFGLLYVPTEFVVLHVPTAFVVLHAGQGVTPVVYLFRILVVLLAVACLGVTVYGGLLLAEQLRPGVGGAEGVDDHGP